MLSHTEIESYLESLQDREVLQLYSDVLLDGGAGCVSIRNNADTLRDKMMVWEIEEPVRWRCLSRMIEKAQSEQGKVARHLKQLSDNEFLDFYRKLMDEQGHVLHSSQRPNLTNRIMDCENSDPARWIKACRQAGIDAAPNNSDVGSEIAASPTQRRRPWTRTEKLTLAGVIATILVGIGAVLV